jgi:hypothetical protein
MFCVIEVTTPLGKYGEVFLLSLSICREPETLLTDKRRGFQ